jgi:O-acetyl-ADP-ribose deacetylase (regulator of RNase III)
VKVTVNQSEIELIQGDITESDTDAIVNAANSFLMMGAGVAGAISAKGGPCIQEECNKIEGCSVGDAVVTSGGNLKAKYVIHAVGPQWGEGKEDVKLRNATINSLKRAEELQLTSIAFPALSTGIFGFPMDRAARIMLRVFCDYLNRSTRIQRIVLTLFDTNGFDIFRKILESTDTR